MVQATNSVGTTTYQVNALGQRVRKTNSSTDTIFHYDTRGHLIAETDPGGAVSGRLRCALFGSCHARNCRLVAQDRR